MVYIIHFERSLGRVRHYVGWVKSPEDFDRRMARHRDGTGSKLLAEVGRQGIAWDVVVVYPLADRTLERTIKNHKCIPKTYCPVCMAARRASLAESRKGKEAADGIGF